MHWKSLRRQVRVVGPVSKVPAAQSDAYFYTRGRGSQIGAWSSAQSRPLAGRAELMAAVAVTEARFPGDVPRPPHWGGYCIFPGRSNSGPAVNTGCMTGSLYWQRVWWSGTMQRPALTGRFIRHQTIFAGI